MVHCAAYGCTNDKKNKEKNKKEKITFHRFPKSLERRMLWMKAVRRGNWYPNAESVLCSIHFREEFIDRTSLCCTRLRENAIPEIFPGHPKHLQTPVKGGQPSKRKLKPHTSETDSAVEPESPTEARFSEESEDSSPVNNPNMSPCIRNENSVQEEESHVRLPVYSQTTTTRPIIQKLKPTRTTLPFTNPQTKARADELETIGVNVTAKLRKMSFTQQSFAKSLIIKILARGLLEELTEDTDLITITNYYDYNNSPNNSNSASSEDLSS